ncbi:MAG TPA: Uma2 family endonuclease [Bacteroidetes bacterium]|nr:Uma2 family endonuclease [Bacteroidota bacterium]
MESNVLTLPKKKCSKEKVPSYLIKEEFDGVPLYYKGYEDVLAGKQTFEEIMAAGGLHAILVTYLTILLGNKLNTKLYRVLTGEVGSKLGKRKNATMDVAIFEKAVLTQEQINRHLPTVPPKIDIEVDLSVANPDLKDQDLMNFRTQKMLDGGVEKIIWIFTLTKKIMVAEKGKDWVIFDWNRDVEIIDGIVFNIPKYLKEEGFDIDVLLK